MSKSPVPSASSRRRVAAFTTAAVVSFSLTLLAGSVAVLANLVPLRSLSLGERVDIGAVLLVAPVLALILAVVWEASRFALSRDALPEPRRQQPVRNWTPGSRED